MTKSVSFARPTRSAEPQADAWVDGSEAGAGGVKPPRKIVPMKRLTLDIPEELHRRVKSGCAIRGEKIADVVRRYLDGEFPAP